MAKIHLNARALEELKPPHRGQVDVWDAGLPGFGIRLSQGGSKSWVVMARRGARRVRLTLGPYPELSIEAAREEATRHLGPGAEALAHGETVQPRQPVATDAASARAPAGAFSLTPEMAAAARQVLALFQAWLEGQPVGAPAESLSLPSSGPVPAAGPAAAHDQAGRRQRILLAEDTETNRMLVLAMLASEPYDIDTVHDGRDAVEAAKKRSYDLILMDVSMPIMDGVDATRAIRALPGPVAKVPIIAMTAHAMAADRERCLAAGMDDYVSKPVSRAELVEKLASRLAARAGQPASAPPTAVLDEEVLRQLRQDLRADSLASFIDSLLPDIQMRVRGIFVAHVAGNLPALAAHAHSLISLAATFGAGSLAALARSLEERAHAGSAEALPPLIEALKPMVEDTLAALTALRQRSA
ncbi:MAG: response regulator [Alphaproteobacteria bacterium]